MGTGNYSATLNNMKLVHWPSMGGLLHLVQRGGDWAGRSPPRLLLAVPNVTAHPSTASVQITVLLYNMHCSAGFTCNVNVIHVWQVFSFFSMSVFGLDVYLRFMAWRHSSEGPYFSSMTSSLGGVTSSSSGTGPQYWPMHQALLLRISAYNWQWYDLEPHFSVCAVA